MKRPAHTNPRYVCSRIRKIFAAKGWPAHKVTGRYSAFGGTQAATEGFAVAKVGCSKTVAVSYHGRLANGRAHDLARGFASARLAEAVELLRSLGYRIDDRGWIECDYYDD